MASNAPQPWELLPMKAAALAQYPNFFHYSCTFFGSMKRDVVNGLPFCLIRPNRLSIDLAKVVRNLGIVDGFEIVQRRNRLHDNDFIWTEDMPEPEDMYDVALFKQRLIRLRLRTDLFSPQSASQASASAGGAGEASAPLAPAFGMLPLSIRNISRASQPVLMYPAQMEAARNKLPSGLFICYHHELGICTDAMAEQYDVPALVAAHVGLPMGVVAAVRGALRMKKQREAGVPLRHVTPLKSWNMVAQLREQISARRAALRASAPPLEVTAGLGAEVEAQRTQAVQTADKLEDGLLAELVRGLLPPLRDDEARGHAGKRGGGGGGGREQWRDQGRRERERR